MGINANIKEILELPELGECKLLNPQVSCKHEFENITVMDNPDIVEWLSGDEILLTNGSSLTLLSELKWEQFFDGLRKKHVAALFIKLQYYVDDIPKAAVSYATKLDIPIIVVPNAYSWAKLSGPIQRFMISKRLNEALKINDSLNELVVHNSSVKDVCLFVAERLGIEVAVFDASDKCIMGSSMGACWKEIDELNVIIDDASPVSQMGFQTRFQHGELHIFRLEKYPRNSYSLFWSAGSEFFDNSYSNLVMEIVGSTLLLSLDKEKASRRVEQRYYISFLEDLLEGAFTSEEEIEARAERLQKKIFDRYYLISMPHLDSSIESDFEKLMLCLKQQDDIFLRNIMYCIRGGKPIFFCPIEQGREVEIVEKACSLINRYSDSHNCVFAISGLHPLIRSFRAYDELITTEQFVIMSSRNILFYENLGLLRLLAGSVFGQDTYYIENFRERILGEILARDRQSKVGLVETLRCYFGHNCSVSETASAMYVHENTLRMRLKTIETLSGLSLKNTQDLVELYTAVLIDGFCNKK